MGIALANPDDGDKSETIRKTTYDMRPDEVNVSDIKRNGNKAFCESNKGCHGTNKSQSSNKDFLDRIQLNLENQEKYSQLCEDVPDGTFQPTEGESRESENVFQTQDDGSFRKERNHTVFRNPVVPYQRWRHRRYNQGMHRKKSRKISKHKRMRLNRHKQATQSVGNMNSFKTRESWKNLYKKRKMKELIHDTCLESSYDFDGIYVPELTAEITSNGLVRNHKLCEEEESYCNAWLNFLHALHLRFLDALHTFRWPVLQTASSTGKISVSNKQRQSHRRKYDRRIQVQKGRKRLSNLVFLFAICGLIIDMSNGSFYYEDVIMLNFVMVYWIFSNATTPGSYGQNVSLLFGILKSIEGQTGVDELEFSQKQRNGRPTTNWLYTKKFSFSESPLVYLGAPGPRTYENQISREETFRRVLNLPAPACVLARQGFFWNGHQVQCYSCNSSHAIDDISQSPESGIWHSPTCRLHNRHDSYYSRLRQVASDTPGRISDDIRDPPGQQSIYIPPGDVRVESYRLSTFNNYPVHSPMDKKALAKGGFYFTGYNDRVKCFACGRTVERWEPSDNPLDLRWHKDSCPFPRGGECGNVPSTSLFARLQGSGSGFNSRNTSLEVLEQRDPRTGEYTRTVRYPADLPEHVRRGGGTFDIGRNNTVLIQGGVINRNPGNGEPREAVSTSVNHQPPRQWRMANVISSDHRRFLNNLFLNRELDRLVSFARWPTGRPTVSPTDLARNGFFYLGDMDRTQCYSCAGVLRNWTANDSARVEHRTHFPNCRFILGTETRNVPVPTHPETPQERQRRFPCRFPSNPHMRSEATRLDTFDSRWPMGRMAATPEEIARAGFFFLGERDRVKCWYCNGGLQHWDYDDAPWVEHAKWFPNCQFLLSVKGQHFVYRHLTTSAYLSRPIIARQEGATVDPVPENAGEIPEDIPPEAPVARGPTPPPTIVDPREEMRKKQELVENALKESDIVKNVLAMGFSVAYVRAALQEKLDGGEAGSPPDIYDTVSGLLEAVMQKETEEEQRRQNEAAVMPGPSGISMPSVSSVYSSMTTDTNLSSLGPAPGSGKYNVSFLDDDDDRDMYGAEPMSGVSSLNSVTQAKQLDSNSPESSASLQEALNKFEEERMCKICFANQADMVFVPCGHMCCCRNCTEAIRHCPVCRVRIDKAIKTYLE